MLRGPPPPPADIFIFIRNTPASVPPAKTPAFQGAVEAPSFARPLGGGGPRSGGGGPANVALVASVALVNPLRDPSEWRIFENTHEAIIDRETFNIVQRIREGRRRLTPMGEPNMLSGMLCCEDCGKKLYQVRTRSLKPEREYYVC